MTTAKIFFGLLVLMAVITQTLAAGCTENAYDDCLSGCALPTNTCDDINCQAYCYSKVGCSAEQLTYSGFPIACAAAVVANCNANCSAAFTISPNVLGLLFAAMAVLFFARK